MTTTEPLAWDPIRSAGSWGVATTNDPADVTDALTRLPGSWRLSPRKALIRRDQWTNLGPGSGPPALSTMNPGFGPVAGGTPCVLTGSRLTGTTMVFFGSNQATGVNVVNDTTVACVSPPGAPGLVNVNALRGTASNAIQYEYRDTEDPGNGEG
jgi:IPT/TIG domain